MRKRSNAVVETDLLDDLTVLEAQHGRAREAHLAAGSCRKRADQEVAEGRPGMGAATFPSADDIVAFRNQIRRAPEVEIRETRCGNRS